MKVQVAEYAGFCMGVDLALKKLDKTIAIENSIVATIGPIIHNPQVLNEYEKKGVKILSNIEDVNEKMHVLIRAHGIKKEDETLLRKRAFEVIDATCPKVKNAQNSVAKATQEAKISNSSKESILLLYGEQEHPEVRSILSYSEIPYEVFSDIDEMLSSKIFENKDVIIASQTTQDKDIFNDFCLKFKVIHKEKIKILDTICDATKQRQEAVRALAKNVDAVIVVGGKTSANTRRLAEISSSYDLPTYHIETIDELKQQSLDKNFLYGLTAGASTPMKYLERVKSYMEEVK